MASIQQQVADLKEQYVQKMVALGRQIIALSSDEQQTAYDRSNDTMSAMGDATWFVDYQDLYAPYQARRTRPPRTSPCSWPASTRSANTRSSIC